MNNLLLKHSRTAAPSPSVAKPEGILPSFFPTPPTGLVDGDCEILKDTAQTPNVYRVAAGSIDKGTVSMYKNRLQKFALKNGLGFPIYSHKHEGPPHLRRFKSKVTVGNKSYETLEFFSTLKESEQAAAKISCQILINVDQENETWHKSLLQELAQKRDIQCPSYDTISSGLPHMPLFVSTVEVGSHKFRGAEAKTWKGAEMNAAKAAYSVLLESGPAAECSNATSVNERAVADNSSQINIHPDTIMKKHKGHIAEENLPHAKRAKSTPENTDVDASPLPGPPVHDVLTGVPRPGGAILLPYGKDKWVAYAINPEERHRLGEIRYVEGDDARWLKSN